jgi:hypothetical protein
MTDEEYTTIRKLSACSFLPGSWAKRFAHSLAELPKTHELTVKQVAALWSTAWHYRRQVGATYARPAGLVSTAVATILEERGWSTEERLGGWQVYPPKWPHAGPSDTDLERLKAWNEGKPL